MTATTAPPKADPQLDELCVNTIRTLAMDAVQKANSGHPGTPMALAPIAYVLYTRVMRHAPEHPDWPNRDRFVLSAGHASMLLYAILHLTGYGLSLDDIKNFRQLDSPAAGHPEYGHAPGIEATTGPLGQGIAMCTGLALGERMLNARLGDDVIDHHTFSIASDGDMQEGISGEAGSLAGHLKLGRLVAFYDDNHISIEGDTALAFSEDVGKRYEAYGWHVQNLGEDIALDRIEQAARDAMAVEDRPSLIIVRTHIAPGSPHKQDTEAAHGSPLGEEEVRLTKQAYGWDPDKQFYVPDEALRTSAAASSAATSSSRSGSSAPAAGRASRCPRAGTTTCRRSRRATSRRSPRARPAARCSSGRRRRSPTSSAAPPTSRPRRFRRWRGRSSPAPYDGRLLHFGIREHAMGATVNGLVLSAASAPSARAS